MKKSLTFFIMVSVFFSITYLTGRSFRVSELPNGGEFGCANCHVSPGGGGARNDFGIEVGTNFLDPPGSSGHVQWGPALAALDSDGDGVSNGVELQDPDGTWQSGDPAPGDPLLVTNPGDPASFVPVELTAFTASVIGTGVVLNWTTVTETNNSGFEIERSADMSSWESVGFVDGNGTTTSLTNYSFADNTPLFGISWYRIKQIDYNGTTELYGPKAVENISELSWELEQNYPNPFNPSTTISFALQQAANVELTVYNMNGEKVADLANGYMEAGRYQAKFDASDLSSGIYFANIRTADFSKSIKMMLLK